MKFPPTTDRLLQTAQHPLPTTHYLPRTILVTGGAGFIGSNFIRYILREHPDWTVINLDKLTYAGNLTNLADIEAKYGASHHSPPTTDHPPRYFFVKGDITDRKLVDSLFTGTYFASQGVPPTTHYPLPTAVINFAAESHVDRSIIDASPFIETNIKGTQVLLDVARAHWGSASGVSPHRLPTTHHSPVFLQISTDEVYGALGETGKFTEESPLLPNSPYAASKAAAELLCRAYHKAYNLPIIITRSSNNYGPYQFPEKLIPLMIRNALHDKELPVYGEGKQIRDWLYVEDNCRAIDLVLQKGKPGEVYNIGGGSEKRNIDVVNLLCDILERLLPKPHTTNHILPTTHHPLRTTIHHIADPRGAAHDFRYALDCSKMKEELGWNPEVDFEEGLKLTVGWYVENQEWVENVVTGEYQEYYEKIYGDDR
jgi:dTDP-glucose 4,6-dehydratase